MIIAGNRIPKCNQEIKGSSLQSPNDPDATARTKAGKTFVGTVGNITETYNGSGASLITDADIQNNLHSDSDFMKEYIDSKPDPESNPEADVVEEQVITDGAYYSSENAEAASKKGILIIPTSLTRSETMPLTADFELTEDGTEIKQCPNGEEPDEQKYNERKNLFRKMSRG